MYPSVSVSLSFLLLLLCSYPTQNQRFLVHLSFNLAVQGIDYGKRLTTLSDRSVQQTEEEEERAVLVRSGLRYGSGAEERHAGVCEASWLRPSLLFSLFSAGVSSRTETH